MSRKTRVFKLGGSRMRNPKQVTLKDKLEILCRREAGADTTDIARCMNKHKSAVLSILKNSDRLRGYWKTPQELKCLIKNRSLIMVDMERRLMDWISDQMCKGVLLHKQDIQDMARNIYENLKQDYSEDLQLTEPFKASSGWFERFKQRAKVTSADLMAALKTSGSTWSMSRAGDLTPSESVQKTTVEETSTNGEVEANSTALDIVDAVELIGEALSVLYECDPDKERGMSVCQSVSRELNCYAKYFKAVSSTSLHKQQT